MSQQTQCVSHVKVKKFWETFLGPCLVFLENLERNIDKIETGSFRRLPAANAVTISTELVKFLVPLIRETKFSTGVT